MRSDVHAMLNARLPDKNDEGKIIFAFDSVHVDFMLSAALYLPKRGWGDQSAKHISTKQN